MCDLLRGWLIALGYSCRRLNPIRLGVLFVAGFVSCAAVPLSRTSMAAATSF